jgi:hypothetical protein
MPLLTLAEAKAALNITTATYDSELQDYIDGTIAAVEYICGPTSSTNATEVLHGCGTLVLTNTPVLTLTSVTGDLVGARDLTYIRVDSDSGVVRANARVLPLLDDWYTVVYTYGRSSIPAALKQAAKVILKHQWSTQRGPSGRRASGGDDAGPGAANRTTVVPGIAYAIPNAALQMMAPYRRGPATG